MPNASTEESISFSRILIASSSFAVIKRPTRELIDIFKNCFNPTMFVPLNYFLSLAWGAGYKLELLAETLRVNPTNLCRLQAKQDLITKAPIP